MPNSTRSRRKSFLLRIHATDAVGSAGGSTVQQRLPWFVVAAGWGVLAAAGGWALIEVLVLLAWATAPAGELGGAFGSATQLWLLAHGGGLMIGGVRWTLVPLGITGGLGLLLGWLTAKAARRGLQSEVTPGAADEEATRARVVGVCTLATGGSYALAVTLVGLFAGSLNQGVRTAVGVLLFAAVAAGAGATIGARFRPTRLLPHWARPIPAAVTAATATILCGGAAALAVGLIRQHERVVSIAAGLGPDAMATMQLTFAQLLFLPNLVIWAGAWTMGAGFTFGQGSVVSPPATDLGLLPSIPVLGAMPAEGPGFWSLLWLLVGVVAGLVAVAVVMRQSPRAGFEEVALVSGFAGLLAALLFTLLAAVARGNLGVERLTGLGPRLAELGVLAGALLGISGLLGGMVAGLVRHLWRSRRASDSPGTGPGRSHAPSPGGSHAPSPGDSPTGDRVDNARLTFTMGDKVAP